MSKKKKIIMFTSIGAGLHVIALIYVIIFVLLPLIINSNKSHNPIKKVGLDYYTYNWYENYTGYYYQCAVENFNKIKPNNSVFLENFYIFYDYTKNTNKTGVSLILDLKFETSDILNQAYSEELSKYEFYDELTFNKNNYKINFIKDDLITKFRRNKDKPYTYGLICYNETDLILRYVSFIDYKTVDDFSNLFECSNCEW